MEYNIKVNDPGSDFWSRLKKERRCKTSYLRLLELEIIL